MHGYGQAWAQNYTGIFINSTKAFVDGKNQNSTIWYYYATSPLTKVNKPKGNMAIWVSEISNDDAIGNIRTKGKFSPGQADLISQLEVERRSEQAEKREREGGDDDFPSDYRTVLEPELPKDASIWWILADDLKFFNSYPN